MPVYNGGLFLKKAIESILCQTYADFEFIIVNDGSTDNTNLIVNSYSDDRIKYVENIINEGIVSSLNAAIDISRGKYIARMDADDIALPLRLEKQYLFMENNPSVAICGTQAYLIDKKDNIIGTVIAPVHNIAANHLFLNAFIHPTTFIKALYLKELKYSFKYQYAEDYHLFTTIMQAHDTANLADYLLQYRSHANNITLSHQPEMQEGEKRVINDQLANLGINPSEDMIKIHHAFMHNQTEDIDLLTLEMHLIQLKKANDISRIYRNELLREVLIDKWYRVLLKSNLGFIAIKKYICSELLSKENISAKHLRRLFKKGLRKIFSLDLYKKRQPF